MSLHRKTVPFVILCLLQAADLLSTMMAVTVPGVVELNPLVRELELWPAKLLVCVLVVLLWWRTKKTGRLWAVCGAYAVIVASNVLLFVTHAKVPAQRIH